MYWTTIQLLLIQKHVFLRVFMIFFSASWPKGHREQPLTILQFVYPGQHAVNPPFIIPSLKTLDGYYLNVNIMWNIEIAFLWVGTYVLEARFHGVYRPSQSTHGWWQGGIYKWKLMGPAASLTPGTQRDTLGCFYDTLVSLSPRSASARIRREIYDRDGQLSSISSHKCLTI